MVVHQFCALSVVGMEAVFWGKVHFDSVRRADRHRDNSNLDNTTVKKTNTWWVTDALWKCESFHFDFLIWKFTGLHVDANIKTTSNIFIQRQNLTNESWNLNRIKSNPAGDIFSVFFCWIKTSESKNIFHYWLAEDFNRTVTEYFSLPANVIVGLFE